MKRTKHGMVLAIAIILCLTLNQSAVNSFTDPMQQASSSLVTDEQGIKQFPGGTVIDFDDKASFDLLGASYPGVVFSPGFRAWNSTDNIYYPPESGQNVAVSN
ncbi:MAG: hypothetical protein KAJ30_06990, partial [Candidatus Heimdallarchaeota archaeon]|nr:hypothetical protein [Candidatus Heimdallarchaeota archaeon]